MTELERAVVGGICIGVTGGMMLYSILREFGFSDGAMMAVGGAVFLLGGLVFTVLGALVVVKANTRNPSLFDKFGLSQLQGIQQCQ